MPATIEEKKEAVEPMTEFLREHSDDTILELRKVWDKALGVVGHKVLGRMLLGKTVDEALRLPKE